MKRQHIIYGVIAAVIILGIVFSFWAIKQHAKEKSHYIYTSPYGENFSFYIEYDKDVGYLHVGNFNITRVVLVGNAVKHVNQVYHVPFRFSPMDLENISMDFVKDIFKPGRTVYIARTKEAENLYSGKHKYTVLALYELDFRLTGLGMKTRFAYYPEISCDNATKNTAVVYLVVGNETKIERVNKTCVEISAPEATEFVKAAEKLIMHLLGVF